MKALAWGLAVIVSLIGASEALGVPPALPRLTDDAGKFLDLPVEICFVLDLRTDCLRVDPGAEVQPPADFVSVRIEGMDHGPLHLTKIQIQEAMAPSRRLAIPRKAVLRIERRAEKPLTLSLYRPEDPTFREPAFRARLSSGDAEVKVPAGTFIASLAVPGTAPDLYRLTAKPAEQLRLVHRPRPGWSMIARIRAASTLKTVPEAEAQLFETIGYGQPDRPLVKSTSGPDGLVLLTGLRPAMVSLEARHPGFLSARAGGLTASPGAFAFREVDLGRGGRIKVQVTAHGRPVNEGWCEIHALKADSSDLDDYLQLLWKERIDSQGSCMSDRLPQGEHKLRFQMGDKAQINRWVTVEEGIDNEVDLALSPARISGEVRRSGKPVARYTVEASRIDREKPRSVPGDMDATAETDEDGRYELTLWTPDFYVLLVRSGQKVPSAERQLVEIEGNAEKRVDFDLSASPLRGMVVDEAGKPVAEASVILRWQGLLRAKTDPQGAFEIDLQEEGTGSVFASKEGYRQSEEVTVTAAPDTAPPPVTLTLKRKKTVSGTILSAAGAPSPGAWVALTELTTQNGPLLYASAQADAEGRFEVETPPGPAQLFVSGPNCPLFWPNLQSTAQLTLQCPSISAALELTLVDETGRARPHQGILLRSAGVIVPQAVLARHLQWLGLGAMSDGAGQLVLAGLAPGAYELFLAALASESTLAGGSQQGYLTTVSLPPLQTTSLEVTIPSP